MAKSSTKTLPFIFGINGTKLREAEKTLFSKYQIHGFILFRRNIEATEQLTLLISELKELYPDRGVPIFVDQEGGRVARIKWPIIEKKEGYPSAQYFGDLYDSKGKEIAISETYKNYFELASDLARLGINGTFAPVCDIRYAGADNVIGDRSFGETPDKVIALAGAAIEGIKGAGRFYCMKHIPGNGRGMVDPHFALPLVDTPIRELEATDFRVFQELSKLHPDAWAMTAHIIYTALDGAAPVTISKPAIDYIRNTIGFKGTLVTDAIEMKALHTHLKKQKQVDKQRNLEIGEKIDYEQSQDDKALFIKNLCEVADLSLKAGCDLVLHCTGDIDEMTALCDSMYS